MKSATLPLISVWEKELAVMKKIDIMKRLFRREVIILAVGFVKYFRHI